MKNKFLTHIKVLSSSVVLALTVSGSAAAFDIEYATLNNLGGIAQEATDGSGLTSAFVPANNIITPADVAAGFFVETFDLYGPGAGADAPSANNIGFNVPALSDNCAINSTGVTVSENQAGVGNVRKGSTENVAAAPLSPVGSDDSCYAYTTPGLTSPSFIDIDYTAFLAAASLASPASNGVFINYLGFYMGSVDDYNSFEFYKTGQVAPLATLDGSTILSDLGGTSGVQDSEFSNVWIELSFSASESFDRLRIISTGIAGEFDNITIGLDNRPDTPVPAPTGLALLGLGLLGMGIRKRYNK
jgi:hypothetical protein